MLRERALPIRLRVALAGALIGGGAIFADSLLTEVMGPKTDWTLVSICAVGGAVGGWLSAGWHGRAGGRGYFYAIGASFLASALAGAAAGTLIIPLLGTLVGAVYGVIPTLMSPYSALGFFLLCLALHLRIRRLRAARVLEDTVSKAP